MCIRDSGSGSWDPACAGYGHPEQGNNQAPAAQAACGAYQGCRDNRRLGTWNSIHSNNAVSYTHLLWMMLNSPKNSHKSYYLLCAMPTEIGATASTYFCDYFWESSASSKGLRVRLSGASAHYGTDAGAFASSTYYAASYSNAAVSAPLCFFDADPVMSA